MNTGDPGFRFLLKEAGKKRRAWSRWIVARFELFHVGLATTLILGFLSMVRWGNPVESLALQGACVIAAPFAAFLLFARALTALYVGVQQPEVHLESTGFKRGEKSYRWGQLEWVAVHSRGLYVESENESFVIEAEICSGDWDDWLQGLEGEMPPDKRCEVPKLVTLGRYSLFSLSSLAFLLVALGGAYILATAEL